MAVDKPVDPESNSLFRGVENLPPELWDDLKALKPADTAERAGVVYDPKGGFVTPFLGVDHFVNPDNRTILVSEGAKTPGFQAGLVLLNYLIHADGGGVNGSLVTGRELNGGEMFFKGPHALAVDPVTERFARDGKGLLRAAEMMGAWTVEGGDASFKLFTLPKILVGFIFYEADDEFDAELTITFDRHTDRMLPLDAVWGMINVLSHRLAS